VCFAKIVLEFDQLSFAGRAIGEYRSLRKSPHKKPPKPDAGNGGKEAGSDFETVGYKTECFQNTCRLFAILIVKYSVGQTKRLGQKR